MGLTTAIGVLQGTNSPMFAISLVFSLIVSHAALLWHSCQRLQHGRQAALAVGAAGVTVVGRPSMQLCAGSACYTRLLPPASQLHTPLPTLPARSCMMPAGCGCTRASRPACST